MRPPTAGADPQHRRKRPKDPAHTGPARQFVITLSSPPKWSPRCPCQTSSGHINLLKTPQARAITRNFGPEDRIALTIPLADGVVIDGKRTARTR